MVYKSSTNTGGGGSGSGVSSLQGETGGITLTSSGNTVTITTPSANEINLEAASGAGTVTTTGTPAASNLAIFSGAASITNGDLSGDITTSGGMTTTLATVNSNIGSFGSNVSIPTFTANAKGLLTAAGTTNIIASASNLIGTRIGSTVVSSSLTMVGTIATGTWQATTIDVPFGGTGLATITANAVMLGRATASISVATIGTGGRILTDQGAATDPAFRAVVGDATLTANGSITLATVNSNVASYGSNVSIPTFTVNGKGLITAAGTTNVVASAANLTGTTIGSTVVNSSLTKIGTIATGTWKATTIDVPYGGTGVASLTANAVLLGRATASITVATIGTAGRALVDQGAATDPAFTAIVGDATLTANGSIVLATVNSNVGSFGSSVSIPTITVNAKGLLTAVGTTSISGFASSTLTNAHIFVGNGSNVATDVAMVGDATLTANGSITLATVNSNIGSFGSNVSIPTFTVNAKGLVTAAGTTSVTSTTSNYFGSLVYANTSVPAGNTITSTSETAFASTYSIPAGSLNSGDVIRVKLYGVYSGTVLPTIQGKIKFGSTVMLDTTAITGLAVSANFGWWAEGFFVCDSNGASGAIEAQGFAEFETAATTGLSVNTPNAATVTVDTTVSQAITATIQWGVGGTGQTITLREMTVEVMRTNSGLANTVANGGTGAVTLTANAVLIGEGTTAVGFATVGTAGRILMDQGSGSDPAFLTAPNTVFSGSKLYAPDLVSYSIFGGV